MVIRIHTPYKAVFIQDVLNHCRSRYATSLAALVPDIVDIEQRQANSLMQLAETSGGFGHD